MTAHPDVIHPDISHGYRASSPSALNCEPAITLSVGVWGAWAALSVGRPTSARVMISWSVGSSPTSGSVWTALSRARFGFCVSLSLSAPPSLTLSVKNKH